MNPTTQLPAHTLTQPLSTEDEHILRQVLANTHQIAQVIDHAKALGLDTAQHEARAAMHHGFATTALERFFPVTMTPPQNMSDQE